MGTISLNKIEILLNNIVTSDEIPLGTLIAIKYNLVANQKSLKSVIVPIINLLVPKKCTITLQAKNSNRRKILIALATGSQRLTDFFKSVLFEEHSPIVSIGNNHLLQQYEYTHSISKTMFILPLNTTIKILKIKELGIIDRIICLSLIKTQIGYYYLWKNHIKTSDYKIIVSDFDRYPTNIPLILAANQLKTPTATIVHGATTPLTNYIPVIANKLLIWGDYHKELFINSNHCSSDIHIIGNPKIKKIRTGKDKPITAIGFCTTKMPLNDKDKLLNLFLDGTKEYDLRIIKIHPLENTESYSNIIKEYSNIQILDANSNPEYFLDSIDVLCTRRSQLGSDALSFNIPIIVIDNIFDDDLQNGLILNEKANCPIINDSIALSKELDRLKTDAAYYTLRLTDQSNFYNQLYKYVGNEAEAKLNEYLENIEYLYK